MSKLTFDPDHLDVLTELQIDCPTYEGNDALRYMITEGDNIIWKNDCIGGYINRYGDMVVAFEIERKHLPIDLMANGQTIYTITEPFFQPLDPINLLASPYHMIHLSKPIDFVCHYLLIHSNDRRKNLAMNTLSIHRMDRTNLITYNGGMTLKISDYSNYEWLPKYIEYYDITIDELRQTEYLKLVVRAENWDVVDYLVDEVGMTARDLKKVGENIEWPERYAEML